MCSTAAQRQPRLSRISTDLARGRRSWRLELYAIDRTVPLSSFPFLSKHARAVPGQENDADILLRHLGPEPGQALLDLAPRACRAGWQIGRDIQTPSLGWQTGKDRLEQHICSLGRDQPAVCAPQGQSAIESVMLGALPSEVLVQFYLHVCALPCSSGR